MKNIVDCSEIMGFLAVLDEIDVRCDKSIRFKDNGGYDNWMYEQKRAAIIYSFYPKCGIPCKCWWGHQG